MAKEITMDGDEYGVRDGEGGVWWPSEEAQAEIQASDDPEGAALEMCERTPMRGTWHS